jgi:hypothetical protein
LNESSASPHYLGLWDESQGGEDETDHDRIRSVFKLVRRMLLQLEYDPGKVPLLAKSYPTECAGIRLRRVIEMAH